MNAVGPLTRDPIQAWGAELLAAAQDLVELEPSAGAGGRRVRKSDLTPLASAFREPRIAFLKHTLDNVLAEMEPAAAGSPASFRLKDLEAFRTERVEKLKWNLGALSSVCNLDCEFCYRYGSPRDADRGVKMMEGRALLSVDEAEARLNLVRDGHGLFSATADLGDDFVNPNIIEIYHLIRRDDPDYIIDTTTHGGFLTEEMVAQLAELKPVDLCVSLNSSDREVRARLMHDKSPQVAIDAPRLLQKHRIWYSISIVAWPTMSLGEIETTIRFADRFSPRAIRVQLPGRTRFHPSTLQYDRRQVWTDVVGMLRRLRRELRTPIYWQPYLYGASPIAPEIGGVMPGSPAADAGVQPEDVILAINGLGVGTREQARALLARGPAEDSVELTLRRAGVSFVAHLRETADHRASYPYCGEGYSPLRGMFGLSLNQGLHLPSIAAVVEAAHRNRVGRTLAISSPLMIETVRDVIARVSRRYAAPPAIDLIAPEAHYFGGDIILGDLLTFDDCAEGVEAYSARHGSPDVVLVPDSMTDAKRDLIGASLDDFRRRIRPDAHFAHHPRILD